MRWNGDFSRFEFPEGGLYCVSERLVNDRMGLNKYQGFVRGKTRYSLLVNVHVSITRSLGSGMEGGFDGGGVY